MTRAEEIRLYVSRNPRCTAYDVAAHVREPHRAISRAMQKMVAAGILSAHTLPGPSGRAKTGYTFGRAPNTAKQGASIAAIARAALRKAAQQPTVRKPQPVQRAIPALSSADYLAAGGRIERLPSQYVPPTRYPPMTAGAWSI